MYYKSVLELTRHQFKINKYTRNFYRLFKTFKLLNTHTNPRVNIYFISIKYYKSFKKILFFLN